MNCGAADHKSWQCQDKPIFTNSIICAACGGAGHIAKDCVQKRPGKQKLNSFIISSKSQWLYTQL